jgi:hypothetical protein
MDARRSSIGTDRRDSVPAGMLNQREAEQRQEYVVRFNTDRALFEAFPTAAEHINTKPADLPPAEFIDRLVLTNKLSEALSFCAYLLRRRDAVAWGCECLTARRLHDGNRTFNPCLAAAETWVRSPSEETRTATYESWAAGDKTDPGAWLALAAAWSGGSLMPGTTGVAPAGPHLTASMVRAAFIMMLHAVPSDQKGALTRNWIAAGLKHAEAGP